MRIFLSCLILILLLHGYARAQKRPTPPARSASTQQTETYKSVVIDKDGGLRITTSRNRTITVPKQGEQVSFRDPRLSPDRTAVGAKAEFGNCCTSYDVALELVVYSRGKLHRFSGEKIPISRWQFVAGRRVVFGQAETHSYCRVHYELRDIQSERLIDSVDVPAPCAFDPDPKQPTIPKWASDLIAAQP